MSMNEFRRLAARMDQQMQQLAAEGVKPGVSTYHAVQIGKPLPCLEGHANYSPETMQLSWRFWRFWRRAGFQKIASIYLNTCNKGTPFLPAKNPIMTNCSFSARPRCTFLLPIVSAKASPVLKIFFSVDPCFSTVSSPDTI